MKIIITHFFIFLSVSLFSQKNKILLENISDFNSKNDSLPFFSIEKEELDTFIIFNRVFPGEEAGANCHQMISFKVDRNGKINSIRVITSVIELPKGRVFKNSDGEEDLKMRFKKETERLIKLTEGFWVSDSIREKNQLYMKFDYYSSSHDAMEEHKNRNFISMSNGANSRFIKKELYNYGVKKFQLNKIPLASLYFEQALQYFPKDIDAHYNLASCYYKLGKKENACEHWKKCVELGDKSVEEQLIKYCK